MVLHLLPYIISFLITLTVGVFALRRSSVPGAAPFAMVTFSQAAWTFGFMLELLSPDLQAKIFWDDLQFLPFAVWAPAFLLFCENYTNTRLSYRRTVYILTDIIIIFYISLVFTDKFHGLIRDDTRIITGEPFSELTYDFTVLSWIVFFYFVGVLALGFYILFRRLLQPHRIYYSQVGIVFLGAAIPILGFALALANIKFTFHRDISPFTFAASNLIIAFGLFRYRLLDVAPVGRDLVIDNLEFPVVVLDSADRVVDLNPSARLVISSTPEVAIGKSAVEVFDPWFNLANRFADIFDEDTEIVISKEGDPCYFDLNISPILSSRGGAIGRVFVFRDTTERKKYEEALQKAHDTLEVKVKERTAELLKTNEVLTEKIREKETAEAFARESEKRYRALFESAEDAILIMKDDVFIDCNPKALQMYGTDYESLKGEHPYNLSPARQPDGSDSKEKALEKIEKALGGDPQFFEWVHQRPDGTNFDADVSLNRLQLAEGDHVLAIVRDVTERSEWKKALQESEEKYRQLIDSIPSVTWIANREGAPVFISPNVEKIYGYTQQELYGQKEKWMERVHPDDREKAQEAYRGLFENNAEFDVEYRVRHKDGSWIWINDRAFNTHEQNGSRLAFGVFSDITDRKRAEAEREELEKRVQHTRKLEAIGTLAGGIAHDFNNILGVIIGNSELLLEEDHFADRESKMDMELVLDAAQRGQDLVNQILAFSRKEETKKQTININILVKETVKMLQSLLPSTIKIDVALPEDDTKIKADPTQIQQILINLASNSAHAMRETGGEFSIELSHVLLDEEISTLNLNVKPGLYCRFAVKDTGPGIEEQIIDRVFEPFFTTKQVDEGTGLGLSVVHGIVTEHQGAINLDSGPGKGTAFYIYFSMAEEEQSQEDEKTGPRQEKEGARIMLVDDDPRILRTMSRIISRLSHVPLQFNNAPQALEHFRKDPEDFDLVISDIIMPDLRGDRLAHQLVSIRPDLPVVLYSGSKPPRAIAGLIKDSNVVFIQKPIAIELLDKTIREILEKNRKDKPGVRNDFRPDY